MELYLISLCINEFVLCTYVFQDVSVSMSTISIQPMLCVYLISQNQTLNNLYLDTYLVKLRFGLQILRPPVF